MTEAPIRLVLDLAAETVPALFKSLGARAGRAMQLSQEWHDTTAGTLAADGVALQSWQDGKRSGWRLARIWPAGLQPWGSDGEAIADSRTRAMLGVVLADGIGPVARFDGRRRMARVGLCRITLVDGALLVGRRREPVCRITVEGPGPALAGLPLPGAAVATESLGAMALRRAGLLPARPLPVLPTLEPTMTVSDALAVVYAHFGERLRRLAPLTAEGAGPEPVHQMRVTVRRVRSALRLFRRAAPGVALDAMEVGLRGLGQALAPARDWDVFLGGTAKSVAVAAGKDAAKRLVVAASRQREKAYADLRHFLGGEDFRRLGRSLALGALDRPWAREAMADGLAAPIADFGQAVLQRQWKRLAAPGPDLGDLPDARLHDIRIEAKRMRYAAELFAALHDRKPTNRFIDRLAALQERLGHLNDGVVAAGLLEALGPAGRSYGAGVARGLMSAGGEGIRAGIDKAWRRMRETRRFWT